MKSNPKSSVHHFLSIDALLKSKSHLKGRVSPVLRYLGHYCNLEKLGPNVAQILQIMVKETWQVIQSLQFIISHHLISYSNPKAIWWSTFISFMVFGTLVQFEEIGPKWGPNSAIHGYGDMKSNPKFSADHLSSNDALLKSKSHLRVDFYKFYGIWGISAIWGNWDQMGPKYCNSWLGRHEK